MDLAAVVVLCAETVTSGASIIAHYSHISKAITLTEHFNTRGDVIKLYADY